MGEQRKLWKIGQIDAIGIRSPHEKELQEFSNSKYPLFKDLAIDKMRDFVVNDIGGKMNNIGLGEDWTITFEIFPQVNIHISYSFFGDEFGDEMEAELKYYFSGERVHLIPGEDLVAFVDILLDFIERMIKNEEPFDKNFDVKSKMMENVLTQRSEPFKFLKDEDQEKLSTFLGAKIQKTSDRWSIIREVFPNIFTEIVWNTKEGLDIEFSGENLAKKISSVHAEFLGIFTINQILRYITLNNLDKNLPDICYTMFSRYFTKQKNWDHRKK
ncbi:hypothetical protein [Candidatus Borrarchaeum sp.]|uniref:hypothetical protein n=1 Tax=Candidatus Borrarchaeum sp. TaxID=2846742 RepID=UPI002580ECFE|nr:hypothetical protein [Candidatus Borrarchaeum sp.]